MLFLQVGCHCLGLGYISGLCALVTSNQQQDVFCPALGVVDPIPRPMVDAQLRDAIPNWLGITHVPKAKPSSPRQHRGPCNMILNRLLKNSFSTAQSNGLILLAM
jgi:hypothetical protein